MKRNTIKSSKKFCYVFVHLSKWTAYIIGLLAAFLIIVSKQPEAVNLLPVAQWFLEAAKISVDLNEDMEKLNPPPNQK